MEPPLILRVLAASVHLAGRASSIVRSIYASKDLNIIDKGVNDPQSRADREAQCCIVQSLSKMFPGINIIGEEGQLDCKDVPKFEEFDHEVLSQRCPTAYSSVSLEDLVVWVDPLDGTQEFTQGLLEHVTILIGLAVGDKPVAGVIAQPFHNAINASSESNELGLTRIVWALVGLGIFGLKPAPLPSKLPYPIVQDAPKGVIPHSVVVTRSHATPSLNAVLDAFAPTEVLRLGGCGYKVLAVLEGRAHVYIFPNPGTKKWDTCAPEAVLLSCGGALTDIRGNAYKYHKTVEYMNKAGVLATPTADWIQHYAKCIPQTVLDSLPKT